MPQGQPLTVPEDGLTTRQRRNRPLVMVHTGDGKGSRPPPSDWRSAPGTRAGTSASSSS